MIVVYYQRFHRVIALFLLALLGLACGLLSATLLGTNLRDQAPPKRPAPPRSTVATTPDGDFAVILQQNPFHAAARSAAPVAFSLQADAPGSGAVARGDLELLGTVVAGNRSLALIRSGQQLNNYRLDDELPGGRIEEISRHQVVIRNHNQSLTTLKLYEEGASRQGFTPGTATEGGTQPSSARNREPSSATQGASMAADAVRAVGDNRWVVARSAAEAARENIGEQLRTALLQPNLVNGKTDGFVVRRIQPGALLARMGLQRGDVIKRVNRTPLDSPEKALQIMQQLREARQLSVDLERGGKPLSFSYEIE